MKKFESYKKSLAVLLSARKPDINTDDIYRMGIIGQFNLTFELAWKAVKESLEYQGVALLTPGSPREVLKSGYKTGLVDNAEVWLDMLQKRNRAIHIYDENEADELIEQIFTRYITAFVHLRDVLEVASNAQNKDNNPDE